MLSNFIYTSLQIIFGYGFYCHNFLSSRRVQSGGDKQSAGTPLQHARELCTQYGSERNKGLGKIRAIFTEKLTTDKILKDKQNTCKVKVHMQSQGLGKRTTHLCRNIYGLEVFKSVHVSVSICFEV